MDPPGFAVRDIGQSSGLPGATNMITATLLANHPLPGPAAITIWGLTGSDTGSTAALPVADAGSGSFAALAGPTASGNWSQAAGALVLSVAAGRAVWPGVAYTLAFNLTNPAGANAAANVSIAASSAALSWPSTSRITRQPYASKRLGVSSANQCST